MINYVFGFNQRVGRLRYLLLLIAMFFATVILAFPVVAAVYRDSLPNMPSEKALWSSPGMIGISVLFLLAHFTVCSMRFRDMGWDPVCLLPAWLAVGAVDHLVALHVPAWAIGHEYKVTIVGGLLNFVVYLALQFWPGTPDD